ncbi:N-acetyltransferase ESCO1 [Biomphalaria glabrata]|nr:N-acetyltransferase ESCO1-like [Biomphalaria glabrata]
MSKLQSSCKKKPVKKKSSAFEFTLQTKCNEEKTDENKTKRKFYKSRPITSTPRQISVIPGKGFDLKFQSKKNNKKNLKKKHKHVKRKHVVMVKQVKTVVRKPLQTFQGSSLNVKEKIPQNVFKASLLNVSMKSTSEMRLSSSQSVSMSVSSEKFQTSSENVNKKVGSDMSGFICASSFMLSDENFRRGENLDVSLGQVSTSNANEENNNEESIMDNVRDNERCLSVNSHQSSGKESNINNSDNSISEITNSTSMVSKATPSPSSSKLFPIFSKKAADSSTTPSNTRTCQKRSESKSPPPKKRKTRDEGPTQMILDAGQKQFGAIQCPVCNMVYCPADPVDKTAHRKFHSHMEEVLKFPGWKKERVVQEYPEDLGRVLLLLPEDPKYMRKKLEEVNEVMSQDLGFLVTNPFSSHRCKIFLYVRDKQICGCCIAEPVEQGYRIIPTDHELTVGQRPWRCSEMPEPACVGISRLWVAADKRKSGIATKLVDCVRQWFNYGTLIPKFRVAFTGPTQDGYKFASTYMGTPSFLVYK